MKYYLVFAGQDYEAEGGIKDYIGDFEDLDEARQAARRQYAPEHWSWKPENLTLRSTFVYEWWQIVEHSTMQVVEQGSNRR